jgi:hypothetical protein
MSNIFYGSSNVYRNFERALSSGLFSSRNLQLVKCTKKAVFDSHLATLTAPDLVISSVLENFINDACTGVSDDAVCLFAHQQLTAHVESLHDFVTRSPRTNVVICSPMFRSVPAWFGPYLSDFHTFLNTEISRLGSSRIGVCPPFVVSPSLLEPDGIHLSPAGGDRFLAHVDAQLSSMLIEVPPTSDAAETVSVAVDGDRLSQILDVVNRNSAQLSNISAVRNDVASLSRATSAFEAFARRRFKDDDLIFARFKEESDAELNRTRENRVVISGLSSPPASIFSHSDKRTFYIGLVSRLVSISCASVDPLPKVEDVHINLRKDQGQPLVEARFDTVASAQAFRREGVKLAKAEHSEFSSLFIANCVTQSTRVRIEILKALSLKLTTEAELAYVQGFVSRPMFQFRSQEGFQSIAEGVGRGYTFVDAMAKFGHLLEHSDLSTAYVRAGSTFIGAMSQYFVVLQDQHAQRGSRPSSSRGRPGRRGGTRPYSRRSISHRRPSLTPDATGDRGTKRSADTDPAHVPSKKTENALVVVPE